MANLLTRLRAVADQVADRYDFGFLFTDDDRQGRTLALLQADASRDPRIRVLNLFRNFGFLRSIQTNFMHARGNAAILIDADLQDPPEILLELIARWGKVSSSSGVRIHRSERASCAARDFVVEITQAGESRLNVFFRHLPSPVTLDNCRIFAP
ncbi:glycosyltransferase [Bradyrhizobium retamae]|uniref:Glycosyltransferase 2-like domain-containing protein n=1 Tax=Bradyrhizobium retamae TaxID=1300035 RepID=A0A0R3NFV9_9BRAD|nr:glycosyltransferase [Bradyrhizobium retamae]KRR29005.1 hypothetical protein CQ13_38990 [Bradyrhizobium retamae]